MVAAHPYPTPAAPFRIGSRGSPLALVQAGLVVDALCAAHGWPREALRIVTVTTSGDRIQDRALAELGGKALWTKELDRALAGDEIDCAVHSMKDVETIRPEAIAIAAMLPRAVVNDRLIGAPSIAALRQGAVIGTSSPRRAAQLRAIRRDFAITLLRGNVATRFARVEAGAVDATLLAAAGLARLGLDDVGVSIPTDLLLPAVAQGAIGIECRADDARSRALLAAIDDRATSRCVGFERAVLAGLGGSCHSPVAVHARIDGDALHVRAQILTEDGAEDQRDERRFPPGLDAAALEEEAHAMAARLLDRASPALRALFGG